MILHAERSEVGGEELPFRIELAHALNHQRWVTPRGMRSPTLCRVDFGGRRNSGDSANFVLRQLVCLF